jgi:hypothetical protein
MKVALVIPRYIDVFYPRLGLRLSSCGQPMANSGCYEEARATEERCARVFRSFEYVACAQDTSYGNAGTYFSLCTPASVELELVHVGYQRSELLSDANGD